MTDISKAVEQYSPLVLQYRGEERDWTLNFQLRPEPGVTLAGDYPTQEEVIKCLQSLGAGAGMLVELCLAAAGAAKRQ